MSGVAVTVVVVSYRSRAELPACLDSIARQTGVELETWVVDNASGDGSADLAATRAPAVHVIANLDNVGFARANNQLLGRLQTPFVALVNPDTILPVDAIVTCVGALEREPDLAVVACRLVDADGRMQPSCHAFPGFVNLIGEAFYLDRIFPRTPLASLHQVGFDHATARRVDWIQGAFLVVRSAAVARVGVFDPEFFMYGEEMDWCRRFRDAGYGVQFLPAPPIVHLGGASSRPLAGPMFAELLKSRVRYMRKHMPATEAFACTGLLAVAVLLRWVAWELVGASRGLGRVDRTLLDLRLRMFRGGAAWVLTGCRLTPPAFASSPGTAGSGGRDAA